MTTITGTIVIALFQSVWQDALVALALWMALRLSRRRSANLRYAVCVAALALMTTWPVLSAIEATQSRPAAASAPAGLPTPPPAGLGNVMPQLAIANLASTDAATAPLAQWALVLWAAGVLLFSLRLAGSGVHIVLLTRRGTTPDPAMASLARRMAQRMGISRCVRIVHSTLTTGPATLGVIRPVILMPSAALMGLTTEQLEAVVAHELAHIRRHDYLVNILQVLVETLLFYHPAIWWASRQIRLERELCCDEMVVRCGGDRVAYARALTSLARLSFETPRLAMTAARGPLAHRITRLLGVDRSDYGPSLWPPVLAVALLLTCAAFNATWAQTESALRFEVASVKQNHQEGGSIGFNIPAPRRFTATNVSLRELIRFSYDVDNPRLVGGPDWIRTERFDVNAVADRDIPTWTTAGPPGMVLSMLRSLLSERFGLQTHRDTRELPVYALVRARPDGRLGPRATASTTDCEAMLSKTSGPQPPPASPADPPRCGMRIGPGQMLLGGVPMARFATVLSPFAQRLVIDRTALPGAYDLQLSWTPERRPQGPPPPDAPSLPPVDPDGASLFVSLEEQLGLKLEPARAPLEVVVIDRVDRPSAD